eukprot:COSAG02_NODE_15571_length_1159_cov_1.272642_1_plen_257_part_10
MLHADQAPEQLTGVITGAAVSFAFVAVSFSAAAAGSASGPKLASVRFVCSEAVVFPLVLLASFSGATSAVGSGAGDACEATDGHDEPCLPGVGECPPVDCIGSWSLCTADCSNKTYTVTTPAAGGGVACEAADGASDFCIPGEGACPVIDCAGSWSQCNELCEKVYSVTTQPSASGAPCLETGGAIMVCSYGEGACPPEVVGQCNGNSNVSADVVCPFGSHQNASVIMGVTTEACCVFDIVVVEFGLEGDPVSKDDV